MEKNRLLPFVTWALMLTPLVLLSHVLCLAVHFRLGLGHWPVTMHEQYNTAAFDWHRRIVFWFGEFTIYAALPLFLLALCFRPLRISRQTHFVQAGVYLAGCGLVLAFMVWDPLGFIGWLLD